MSIGLIIILVLVILLLGGFSGRFGGYGYGYGHGGMGVIGTISSSSSYCCCWVGFDPVCEGCVGPAFSRRSCRWRRHVPCNDHHFPVKVI